MTRIRTSSIAWLAIGVLLIGSAVIIKWMIVPALTKLPADLNQSQRYEGSISALNPQAFAANDLANLITPTLPITANRSLTVEATDGDTAIVTSNSTLTLPDGSTQQDVHSYAVNRVDYRPIHLSAEKRQALVPPSVLNTFEDHEGIAFSFPMNPEKDGNLLYDSVTRSGQQAKFINEGTLEGRDVYNYEVSAAGPIESPTVLAQFENFPPQLPKAVIAGLLGADIIPVNARAILHDNLASLPDTIDIGFGSSNQARLAVDAQFGAPMDVEQIQSMYVTVPVNGTDVPVLPLSTVRMHTADGEVANLAGDLSKNATLLAILKVWLPAIMAITGLLLVVLACKRWRRPADKDSERYLAHV
ncbi:DUF3068 domain-containing protein (plasmid) [Rhodococcus sp. ZPP]|uniref:porin PorA family protein n=1 Tax=Rhodococcus sp. ZPP TaxID=2749906 RepID=UPI001AD8988F|nr:porin PorA family protein [Rhodococcus sp. ZPP]QTJ70323.1 DUF3068 domain-containing protein [Rhodococcus sp. ZPP]